MDYKTILENWQRFAQSTKPLTLNESREIMNEISAQAAERIYDWTVSYTHLTLPTNREV